MANTIARSKGDPPDPPNAIINYDALSLLTPATSWAKNYSIPTRTAGAFSTDSKPDPLVNNNNNDKKANDNDLTDTNNTLMTDNTSAHDGNTKADEWNANPWTF